MNKYTHAYRPLAMFKGRVLKYAGMVKPEQQEVWREEWDKDDYPYLAGVVYLDEMVGDRINADTLTAI